MPDKTVAIKIEINLEIPNMFYNLKAMMNLTEWLSLHWFIGE